MWIFQGLMNMESKNITNQIMSPSKLWEFFLSVLWPLFGFFFTIFWIFFFSKIYLCTFPSLPKDYLLERLSDLQSPLLVLGTSMPFLLWNENLLFLVLNRKNVLYEDVKCTYVFFYSIRYWILEFYYLPNFIPNWYICAFSIVAFVAFVWSNHIPPPHLPKGKKYLYFSIGKYFSNLKMSFRCVLIH